MILSLEVDGKDAEEILFIVPFSFHLIIILS